MIAPLREPPASNSPLRTARRLAAQLLPQRDGPAFDVPRVPSWKAWLFAGWALVVAAVYLATMFGISTAAR
jgi:hypothetical protein